MAVTNSYSTEYTNVFVTTPPVMNHTSLWGGRVRFAQFTCNQSGAGDATSDFLVVKLPPGKVALLAYLSFAYINWTTASATLDCGWAAYTDPDGTAVSADTDGIDNGVDVDTAGFIHFGSVLTTTGGIKNFESRDGVDIYLTSQDEALADDDDAVGGFFYVVD